MLKSFCAALLAAVAGMGAAAADAPTLADARLRWLKGDYEEAQSLYEDLARNADTKIDAVVGQSRALESVGEYGKALDAVESALKDAPKEPKLLARRAELLYLRGRIDDAVKDADAAFAASKPEDLAHFQARWVRARVYRDRGELDKADAECRWFVHAYTDRSNDNDDIKDPEELLLVGLAGTENARTHHLSKQFAFILNTVYDDAEKLAGKPAPLWQAEYQSGAMLLEKYNQPGAVKCFDKALAINPRAAEALVGKGEAALQKMEIKQASDFADQALKINPRLPDALLLKADVQLTSGEIGDALKTAGDALAVNPRDEHALARKAACLKVTRKPDEYDAVVKTAEANDPKAAVFYFDLGDRLEGRQFFEDARACYEKARTLQPAMPGPAAALGLLDMRLGLEDEAAPLLEEGFNADTYNLRVNNMRKVLTHLKDYDKIETKHFVLRFDPKSDGPLAHYMADYLEEIYADLASKFHYEPKGPILIEVFNNHEMFSGRVIALPDLHTVGATTGRMFAMVSPNGKGISKPFNWARVLRHEMVHIFNLDQTHFQTPHWLTEGLAVNNEGFDRPQEWNDLLRERVPKDDLMDLDDIDLGFIRPRTPLDWSMAYCQSQLYVDYMKDRYGADSVAKMLDAYRDGLGTDEAVKKACGVEKAAFEKGYREYLADTVKKMGGKPPAKARSFRELKTAHDKDPNDLDTAAELAEAYLNNQETGDARQLAQEVLDKKKNHPKASFVMAQLAHKSGDDPKARELLEGALDEKDPDVEVLQALAKVYYDAGDFDKAAHVCDLGLQAEPYNADWLAQLARIYAQKNDKDKQIEVLKKLLPKDADDLDGRKKLARLLLEKQQYADAEKFAREAIEIDVTDKEARDDLLQALRGQNKNDEADKLEKMLGK